MLFILKPYENSIYNSFEKSIDISISYTEGKKDKEYQKKRSKKFSFYNFQ